MLNAAMQAPFTLAAELRCVHNQDVTQEKFIREYAQQVFRMLVG